MLILAIPLPTISLFYHTHPTISRYHDLYDKVHIPFHCKWLLPPIQSLHHLVSAPLLCASSQHWTLPRPHLRLLLCDAQSLYFAIPTQGHCWWWDSKSVSLWNRLRWNIFFLHPRQCLTHSSIVVILRYRFPLETHDIVDFHLL